MSDLKDKFIDFCGDKYDRFMEKLVADFDGKIELRFWQEKLIDDFLMEIGDPDIKSDDILRLVRDGSEFTCICPIPDCDGLVSCINRKNRTWGCNECGQVWRKRADLDSYLNYAKENFKNS